MILTNTHGLTLEDIAKACPAVVAEEKHESRSERYTFVPTRQILEFLLLQGFVPTQVVQTKTKKPGFETSVKHMVRIRHRDYLGDQYVDAPETCLVNSSGGQSAYRVLLGWFRGICENGMIMGDYDKLLHVKHMGDILQNIMNATYKIVEEGQKTIQVVESMKQVNLSRPEQLYLAERAIHARFDDKNPAEGQPVHKVVPYRPEHFLRIDRREDNADDLYTVMQRIQSNILPKEYSRPYQRVRAYDNKGRHTILPISEIDRSNEINGQMWNNAMEMLAEKKPQLLLS